ncbi:DinB family protein [Microbacterium terricola]|uniref:DinB family protein n=1 Tax=Microbacterium terricola TaxID=344163 RepID=A0ABM8DXU1_9MICO|nr:DinB family protein [Microbacterium terricola]UYK38895.1 DinB family protein [Microbacterium terricola]BDV30409.1 hypothetical protein Microterr_10690 [Microbacterium terricola]
MIALLRRRFDRAHSLYADLADELTAEQLGSTLADLPSNTIGGQLWCVLGARESYPRAAVAGEWQGFTSPLDAAGVTDPTAVRAALRATHADVDAWLGSIDPADEDSLTYALALLEHETQHHGQLIRYLYGLGIPRPASWQRQYALDEES